MRQFYFIVEKGVALPHRLSWSLVLALLPIDNINEINYYIDIFVKQNLSYRELRFKVKNKEYDRLPKETKNKLLTNESAGMIDFIKHPIII